jgi:hypothetical protein
MTNPSREPEEQVPQKPIRFILPREVCTDPETAARIMHRGDSEGAEDVAWWVGPDTAYLLG